MLSPVQTLFSKTCSAGLWREANKVTNLGAAFSYWKDVPSLISPLTSLPSHPGVLSHHPGSPRAAMGKSRRVGSIPPKRPYCSSIPERKAGQGPRTKSGRRQQQDVRVRDRRRPGPKRASGPDNENMRRGCARVLQGARPPPPTKAKARGRDQSSPARPALQAIGGSEADIPILGPGPGLPRTALTFCLRRPEGVGSGGCLRPGHLDQLTPAAPPSLPTERARKKEPRLGRPRRPPITNRDCTLAY